MLNAEKRPVMALYKSYVILISISIIVFMPITTLAPRLVYASNAR